MPGYTVWMTPNSSASYMPFRRVGCESVLDLILREVILGLETRTEENTEAGVSFRLRSDPIVYSG